MTKLHRTGIIFCLSGIVLAFAGFYVAGYAGAIEFSSRHFWFFVLFPLFAAAGVTGLSWKWPIVGGAIGVVMPLALFFVTDMESLYLYIYSTTITLFFTGGVLLVITTVRAGSGH